MGELFRFSENIQNAYENLQTPIAIFQYTENGIFPVTVSEGFCELFEFKSLEQAYDVLKEDSFSIIHTSDVKRIKEEILSLLSKDDRYDVVYRSCARNSGIPKLIRSVVKFVHMEDDVVLAHISYMDETTDVYQKLLALQESVSSLLENMPAMTFSKDINTRKYLACNQAFADYAHKETPEGVVGLTDFEIFDEATAYHFIEDDKKALAMDKAYIFYEDVPDAVGNPRRFQTTKLKFTDTTGRECLLGLCQDVTEAMLIKKEYDERLANANTRANLDALTGIRNKLAYNELVEKMNRQIANNSQGDFAITVFDLNDLKKINDTKGHQTGDIYICDACKLICQRFKHSPVFRIGGDEFVAVSCGEDYENIEKLVNSFAEHNAESRRNGGIVIACGMARFDNDDIVAPVFLRADKKMYENKKQLKGEKR